MHILEFYVPQSLQFCGDRVVSTNGSQFIRLYSVSDKISRVSRITRVESSGIYIDGRWLLVFGPGQLKIFDTKRIVKGPRSIVFETHRWKWFTDLTNRRIVYWKGKNIYTYEYVSNTTQLQSLRKTLYSFNFKNTFLIRI